MIHLQRSAIVRYTPAQMFDLVNDIEHYPQRFSWCSGANIVSETSAHRVARLNLRLGGLKISFTTRNQLLRPERIILQLVEGPFKQLSGYWEFFALGEKGCKVSFALDFTYANQLTGAALRLGFQALASRLVEDFSREAERLYGKLDSL